MVNTEIMNRLLIQCEELGIRLEQIITMKEGKNWIINNNKCRSPEDAALAYFKLKGYSGSKGEGRTLLLMFKAITLDLLDSINIFKDRQDAIRRYFEAQCIIHHDKRDRFVKYIRLSRLTNVAKNLEEIYSDKFVKYAYPNTDRETVMALFNLLSVEVIESIFNIFFSDPYKFRKGWPDLTVYKNNDIKFVEVKTTDILHQSQLNVVNSLFKPLGLSFFVVQLVKPM
jgi:hypothetical protein